VNGAELCALAAQEKNHRIAKRLRAIAHLADGMSAMDAAIHERIHEATVLAHFQKGGVNALRRVVKGRAPKLSAEQLSELAAMIEATPVISFPRVCEIVKERFNVSYTTEGITRLVREGLGLRVGGYRQRGISHSVDRKLELPLQVPLLDTGESDFMGR
jgi:transposase